MTESVKHVFDDRTEWHLDGKLHRENGPAAELDGRKYWYQHGKLHREDGPAITYKSAYMYFLFDEFISQVKFKQITYSD